MIETDAEILVCDRSLAIIEPIGKRSDVTAMPETVAKTGPAITMLSAMIETAVVTLAHSKSEAMIAVAKSDVITTHNGSETIIAGKLIEVIAGSAVTADIEVTETSATIGLTGSSGTMTEPEIMAQTAVIIAMITTHGAMSATTGTYIGTGM